jgi:potassium-transporting ATPase KdpC subunit
MRTMFASFVRALVPSLVLTAVVAVGLGLVYPLVVYGIGQVAFPSQADGSFIKRDGVVVGSSLIGQNFLDKNGNPLPQYFQPRPSDAGSGYNAQSSGASNLGPGDPRLVGNNPKNNPYATPSDPACVPVQATSSSGALEFDKNGNPVYEKNPDGTYVCDPNTVPERVIAYRAFNHVPSNVAVPVDAVTASGSGLDPDISVANADLQAPRVAAARGLPLSTVMNLVSKYTTDPFLGFIGESTVNVLELNLALDALPGQHSS